MNDTRRAEILATYELYSSIFDEVARRRMRGATVAAAARRAEALAPDQEHAVPAPELSSRMREVLKLIADGHSNKGIARRLRIGPETVKSHVAKLLSTLEAENRAHAVGIAFRTGLLGRTEQGEAA